MELLALIPIIFWGAVFGFTGVILIYLIIRRQNIKKDEKFEKRDN